MPRLIWVANGVRSAEVVVMMMLFYLVLLLWAMEGNGLHAMIGGSVVVMMVVEGQHADQG